MEAISGVIVNLTYLLSFKFPNLTYAPDVDCTYNRAKARNGAQPTAPDTECNLTITCTCRGAHEPLVILWLTSGRVRDMFGQSCCWFSLFLHCSSGLDDDSSTNILRYWNTRQKKFGATPWGAERLTTSVGRFAKYCGLDALGPVVQPYKKFQLMKQTQPDLNIM